MTPTEAEWYEMIDGEAPEHLRSVNGAGGGGGEEPPEGDEREQEEWEEPDGMEEATARAKKPDLFRRYSAAELMGLDRTFRWLARGMLVEPTYGQIAGELKSLKTYVSLFTMCGLADGHAVLGRFAVEQARTVLAYVGEGGRVPYTRRLERVAAAVGVAVADLPLHLSFDVAPIASDRFQESLRRDLEETKAAVVFLDPYYAYHGTTTKSADLHQEGALLTSFSALCGEYGASLMVVNHFNQTGSGTGLKRITMAGSGEWADSWTMLSHRETPDVENGRFKLLMEVGSRQWGGTAWDLNIDLGRFDDETGEYDGAISFDLGRHRDTSNDGDPRVLAVAIVGARPAELTRSELVMAIGGRAETARDTVDSLERQGRVVAVPTERLNRSGKPYHASCFVLPPEAVSSQDVDERDETGW